MRIAKFGLAAPMLAAIGSLAYAAGLKGDVRCDGSSTVGPITEAMAEEFKKAEPGVNVTVGISGTGGGFKRFSVGEIDISNASRPIKKEEHDKAAQNKIEYIELPVAYDGLSIVVNTSNTWATDISVDELKKIYLEGPGAAKTWADVRTGWPSTPIKIYSPGTDSGTFDYFKEVIAGKDGSIRKDMSVSEDDNVLVRGVSGDPGAIGFFGCAYYFENKDKLRAVPVNAGKGAIAPTHDTIQNGSYAPFSRPLFIYVNKKSADRPEVKAFIEYYLSHAPEIAEEVGYVKLPAAIYARVKVNFAAKKAGTQFMGPDGKAVHGALEKLYN